jgi:acetyl esterase/lipase
VILIGESSLPLTKSGTFSYKAVADKPQFLAVKYQAKQFKIFMEPNEKMAISFDAKNMDNTIKFKGNSPATNLFLFKKSKIDEQLDNYFYRSKDSQKLFSKDEEVFLHEIDSLKDLYLKPLADLLSNKSKINQSFVLAIKNSINFSLDKYILYYPQQHEKITGDRVFYGKKTQAYLDTINLDNPDFIGIDGYAEFGKVYLFFLKVLDEFKTNNELKKSDNQFLQASFDSIDRIFKNKTVKDYWRFFFLRDHIENNGIKHIASFIDTFNNTCLSEEYKKAINSLYQKESEYWQGHLIKTYKTIDGFELDAHISIPDGLQKGEKRPALVFFHGGGWAIGSPVWGSSIKQEFGFVKVCIEYRTFNRYRTLPFEQISDAKSAIRWLREHADEFHIIGNKIIASGNSAGGHLALCTAMLDSLDEPNENKSVSSVPNALILNSAAYDLTIYTLFEEFVTDKKTYKQRLKDISPAYNIKKILPPLLIFHGKDDTEVPYGICETFVKKMKDAGNDIYFYPLEGLGHFIWYTNEYRQIAEKAKKEFFKKLGYL